MAFCLQLVAHGLQRLPFPFEEQNVLCLGSNGMVGRGALVDQPHNALLVAYGQGFHFFQSRALAVGQIVAHQFASLHAEGLEAVALSHSAAAQTSAEPVSIEAGGVGTAGNLCQLTTQATANAEPAAVGQLHFSGKGQLCFGKYVGAALHV